MAKRMTKAEMNAYFWLFVIGVPIYGLTMFGETFGWLPLVFTVLSVFALISIYKISKAKQRRAALMEKYDDEELVDDLMNQSFWQGQTAEQLVDSLGKPHDIDQKVLKTKKKEVWKYEHQGGNRYGLRITLDNDHVVGWDQKT